MLDLLSQQAKWKVWYTVYFHPDLSVYLSRILSVIANRMIREAKLLVYSSVGHVYQSWGQIIMKLEYPTLLSDCMNLSEFN